MQRRTLGALAVLLTGARGTCEAQAAPDPRRLAVAVALDAGTLPDAFTSRCGRTNTGTMGWGAQFAALTRLRHWLVVQGDVSGVVNAVGTGCTSDLPMKMIAPDV